MGSSHQPKPLRQRQGVPQHFGDVEWTGVDSTLTLRTVLLSIQTLFCEDPLQNEVCFFTFVTSFEAERTDP